MSGVWRIPGLLAAVSLAGLAAAIVGDGVWDVLGWAGLAVPLAVMTVRVWTQRPGA